MSCVSHPDGLPDLFLDRSLGRIKVPRLLRAAGLRLVTLSEHYTIPADEGIADDEWLGLAGSRGWVVFMKDTRIRYNRAEREAVKAHCVRCFCLANQNLGADEMAARFLDNLGAIGRACEQPGPFMYAVHRTRVEKLSLGDR
jgi:PIN like domain